jgi:hypothetical protein
MGCKARIVAIEMVLPSVQPLEGKGKARPSSLPVQAAAEYADRCWNRCQ